MSGMSDSQQYPLNRSIIKDDVDLWFFSLKNDNTKLWFHFKSVLRINAGATTKKVVRILLILRYKKDEMFLLVDLLWIIHLNGSRLNVKGVFAKNKRRYRRKISAFKCY